MLRQESGRLYTFKSVACVQETLSSGIEKIAKPHSYKYEPAQRFWVAARHLWS